MGIITRLINPLTVSGSATEVNNYLKIVNANASSSPAGTTCSDNSQCLSYKCDNSACVGNYLGGNFVVSDNYQTVEFIPDQECGVNGCGEKIYCLPANSHLAVQLKAADLKACTSDSDCAAFDPFKTCSSTPLGYKTCQNPDSQNYPTANIGNLDGVVDAALNSLDGDRSAVADGPINFYNDNYSATSTTNSGQKDNYEWSFYVNNQIRLTPPQITSVTPAQGQGGTNVLLADPVEIHFNSLMMNSSLRTGSVAVSSGTSTVEHKLINLWSASPSPLGYWVDAENVDTNSDGQPDTTYVKILHSPFPESVTFNAQVGSGVKDIYQNCYKPSVGPDCAATPTSPSCCFGAPTATLGADGNCQ